MAGFPLLAPSELVFLRLGQGGTVQLEGGRSVTVPDIPFAVRAEDLELYEGSQELPLEVLVEGTLQALQGEEVDAAMAESYRRFLFEVEPSVDQLLVARGLTLANQGDMEGAAERFRALVHLCPDHAVAWMNLGLCLVELARGRPDWRADLERDALEAFLRAVEVDDRLAPAHFYLGCLLRDRGDEAAARAAWRRCVNLGPLEDEVALSARNLLAENDERRDLDRLFQAGCLAVLEGRLEDGTAMLRRVAASRPDAWQASFFLGLGERLRRDYEAADVAFREVVRLRPEEPEAWTELGVCAMERGRLDEAEDCFTRALELFPACSRTLCNLGLLHLRRGRRLEAQRSFTRAKELDPEGSLPGECLALLEEEWAATRRVEPGWRVDAEA